MSQHIVRFALLQKYVIDRVLEDDGVTGDQYGPFNAEHIKEERERLKQSKVSTHHILLQRHFLGHAKLDKLLTTRLQLLDCKFLGDSDVASLAHCPRFCRSLHQLQAHAKARREAEKEKLAKQASKQKVQARSQIAAAGSKVKETAQKAVPTQKPASDSSSSDDESSSSESD